MLQKRTHQTTTSTHVIRMVFVIQMVFEVKVFFTSRGGLRCLRTHLAVDRCHTNRVCFFTSRGTDRQDSGRGVAGNRIVNTDLKNIGMIKEENRILIKLVVKILPKSLQLVTTHPSTLSRNQDSCDL